MTTHVVCRDCDFEALVDDADADATVETHEEETGHNVDDGRVDGGTRLVTDGGRVPVEEMSVDELREEYRERADIGYSDPEDHDRKMALWNELRDRVDVEQPECPECGERNWGQAPGEPKKCNACGSPLGEPELAEDIQQAWNEIMRGDGDENELVTDGGEPTLKLTDDGLEIPEDVSVADGVVVRARGATVDHKPGSEDRPFYPMIDERALRAEDREVINEQLDEDEVTVKQYGEDAETYRVVIPETDGGEESGADDFEAYEETLDELNDALLEAYAAGFAKGVEFADAEPGVTTDVEALKKKEPVQESHFHYWEGRQKPIEGWLREHFIGDEQPATDGGRDVRSVHVGQVKVEVFPDDYVADLFDRTDGPLEVTAENTVLCRPFSSSDLPPSEEDYISYDLEEIEDGDELELYRLPASERPAYEEAVQADGGGR